MKTIQFITIVIFMVSSTIQAQIINIPDTNFKNRLLQPNNAHNLQGQTVSVDANQNEEIEIFEAENISALGTVFSGANIIELTGLEYFINIKNLLISGNQITQFNFPSLTSLIHLNFEQNPISFFNFSHHPNLRSLSAGFTLVNYLNFPTSNVLEYFYGSSTLLTSVDIKNNPNLKDLRIGNTSVSSVNIKNTNILFDSVPMLIDCWANIPLTYICCDAEDVPALTAFLTNCGHNMSAITIDTTNTCALSSGVFKSYAIKVYPNPSTGVFNLNLPAIFNTEVEVFNTLGQKVYQNNFKNQQDVVLDLDHLNKGLYLLKVNTENGDKFQEKIVVN